MFWFTAVSRIMDSFFPFCLYVTEEALIFFFVSGCIISFPSCSFFRIGEFGSFSFLSFALSNLILSFKIIEYAKVVVLWCFIGNASISKSWDSNTFFDFISWTL